MPNRVFRLNYGFRSPRDEFLSFSKFLRSSKFIVSFKEIIGEKIQISNFVERRILNSLCFLIFYFMSIIQTMICVSSSMSE